MLVQLLTWPWPTFLNAHLDHAILIGAWTITKQRPLRSKQKESNLQNTVYITPVTAKQSLILLQREERRQQQQHYVGDLHYSAETILKGNTAV